MRYCGDFFYNNDITLPRLKSSKAESEHDDDRSPVSYVESSIQEGHKRS